MNGKIKEIDEEGLEILSALEKADRFNSWMYDTIAPYCKGKILEIGSGIGNISKYFISEGQDIVLSDLRDNYCGLLTQKFPGQAVLKMDLIDPDFDTKHAALIETFDTVFALNVVEHIEDDLLAIANCRKLLKPGGTLIILVPAYQSLYNNFDTELEHFRRYTKKTLRNIIISNRLTVNKLFSFNFIGIFGWFVSGSILKKKTLPEGQLGFFNLLVPVFKVIDHVVLKKIGLSVICVAEKKSMF